MHHHDPVNAISEAEATGRTAEIFAEIRETMQIPLVTSIWRTLDAVEGGLESAWAATKPIYESGQADALLAKLREEVELPVPPTLSARDLTARGIAHEDCDSILSVLAAYNRSNTLNLIALTALVSKGSSTQLGTLKSPEINWPALPPLLAKSEIDTPLWALLKRTIPLGAKFQNTALPTLWRHLIHWPGFIELVLEHYAPLHQSGQLFDMVAHVTAHVETHAPDLSHFRDDSIEIPEVARQMIEDYVGEPPSVSRMSSLGTSVENWLRSCL